MIESSKTTTGGLKKYAQIKCNLFSKWFDNKVKALYELPNKPMKVCTTIPDGQNKEMRPYPGNSASKNWFKQGSHGTGYFNEQHLNKVLDAKAQLINT